VLSGKELAAFEELREELCKATCLFSPDPNKPFVIHSDASDRAVAAVLSQEEQGESGVSYRPIAFTSKKLSDCQTRYAIIDKEAYALMNALDKFSVWVVGTPLTVRAYSDHNPLQFLQVQSPLSPRLLRWSVSLSRFSVIVQFIKGTDNIVSDYFTRLPNMY
jgi:hypothetical protein